MTTFADAREVVRRALEPTWPPDAGTLVVLPQGYEDADGWLVVAGAREALVDGDHSYRQMDAPALVVDKHTGRLARLSVLESLDRIGEMRPVSA